MTGSGGDARTSDKGLSPSVVEALAGLTAGTAATLVVHPLDIAKTRMQVYRDTDMGTGPRPSTATVLRGLLAAPRPVTALYRGLAPNLLGSGVSWAAFFTVKARAEYVVRRARRKPAEAALSAGDYFVASALAGVTVQVLTNPLWVLKTRMLASDRAAQGAYSSMWAGARRVWQVEGWRGFYRGLAVGLLGVSHGAVQFSVYEPLKRWGHGDPSASKTLLTSTVAKLVAGVATYPYQVIRSRLQNDQSAATLGATRGILRVTRQVWRDDGVFGFYRGLVPSMLRVLPATWVTFLVYENVHVRFPEWWADRRQK